jgi:hypothetical protein
MKRGEDKHARIDRLIDHVWGRIFARQEAAYRDHNRSTPIFEERSIAEIEPGTWVYDDGHVVLGVLSRCKSYIRSPYGRYRIPTRPFIRAGRKEQKRCNCVDCAAVRERREMAVAA